jgi:maleylpyruvate isomerase
VSAAATPPTDSPPVADLGHVSEAQARFDAAIAALTDEDVRAASRLPGWTIGHVLSHVARNADSHLRRTEASIAGETIDQYPGGFEGRAAEIEAGAHRSAADLVDDVRTTGERLDAAWRHVPPHAWAGVTRDVGGAERALSALPSRRWQELEVHLVDLGIGPSHRDWSDDFVAAHLPRLREALPGRLGGHSMPVLPADLDERDELAWLYDRLERPDLPTLAPYG